MSKQFLNQSKIADVRDIKSLERTITGDIVVNLAAVHRDDITNKIEYQQTNVDGAQNVADVCSQKQITKIIFTSSVAVYGYAEPGTCENGKINPFNEYGRTKYAAEEKLREWQASASNSLIIIRPTVVFGEGNRGNVYNLMKQITTGLFVMIGRGENKKSLAYVGNVVAFIEQCITTTKTYALYNYVDTPDYTMNEFVDHVKTKVQRKKWLGIRVPYWAGTAVGYIADIINMFVKKKLPVSSIRIKKFTTTTEFQSKKHELDSFEAPYLLADALNKTLEYEFISPNVKNEVFFTE